jgi:uronate dehydrogenase
MSHFDRALITGAAGALGRELRRSGTRLARQVRLTDRIASEDLAAHEQDQPFDLADLDAVLKGVAGCDAIVHLGAQATEAGWEPVLQSNIIGTYNIYEAARRHGVKRIVYASSIHAVGYYERNQTIDAFVPTKPDSLYGVSKTFGENLASYYFDKFGIESVCLRIGSCYPEPADRRHLITWLSFRDFRQLVERSLSAPRVGFMISYATSGNSQSFWDNRLASVLGYAPEDNAEDHRDKVFAKTEQGDPHDPAIRYQGGIFCAWGHFDDREPSQ